MSDPENRQVVKNATQARAGFRDLPVGIVLAVSLGLVVVLFVLVYVMFFGTG